MASIRDIAIAVLPDSAVRFVRKQLRQRHERRFASQAVTTMAWGDFEIEVPKNHPLLGSVGHGPIRDQCIGNTAACIVEKYPDASFLDIGANIGDTAALLASHTGNRLILVEASDYFFEILQRNARRLPNETVLIQALVGDGSDVTGDFLHWGGTSSFHEDASGLKRARTLRLAEVADAKTGFVKSDTDGFDFTILRAGIDWLAAAKPAILFENQIRTREDLTQADALFADLSRIGYTGFVVWDDPGFHMLSTEDIRVLKGLDHYLFEVWQRPMPQRICNYDVLCLHRDDEDVFERMRDHGGSRGARR